MEWILFKWIAALMIGVAVGVIANKARKTEAGLFNVWVETQSINHYQSMIIKKYSVHKWCVFRVVTHTSDMDYFNEDGTE